MAALCLISAEPGAIIQISNRPDATLHRCVRLFNKNGPVDRFVVFSYALSEFSLLPVDIVVLWL